MHRFHYIELIHQFIMFMFHFESLMIFLFLLLPCKNSDLNIRSIFFCFGDPQRQESCEPIEAFHRCLWSLLCLPSGQGSFSAKTFCCNDQLISHSHELVEIRRSRFKFSQVENFCCNFAQNFWVLLQIFWVVFSSKKCSYLLWRFQNLHSWS